MSSAKGCADPTHKPHAGLAGGYAKLLSALQWALNAMPADDREFLATSGDPDYHAAYQLAWGT